MFLYNSKRVAFDAKIEVDGVYYSVANPSDREAIGVIEVSDPVRPTPESDYYIQEIEEAPYLSVVKKSDEQLAQQALSAEAQAARIYLDDTDYLFTVDKFATLEESRKNELILKRDAARQKIRDYNNTLLQKPVE